MFHRSTGCPRVRVQSLVFLLLAAASACADWSERLPSGFRPDARSMHALAWDADDAEAVLFGGGSTYPLSDTWTWDGDEWSRKAPSHVPGPRIGHAMAWFAGRHRVVLFGGEDPSEIDLDETWEWNGEDWSLLPLVIAPSPRHFHAVAYDAQRGRLVLFGGRSGEGALGDTWEFDGESWRPIDTPTSPSARFLHAMAYDEVRHRVVLFGGTDDANSPLGDTWEWDGEAWTRATPAVSPEPRYGHAMAWDGARGTVALFGGKGTKRELSDAWEWDGTNWSQRPLASGPVPRRHHAMVFDPSRGGLLVFGGNGPRRDLWELSPVDTAGEIACGLGAGGGGFVDVLASPLASVRPISACRFPWIAYDEAVGQARPACGNLDNDPWDELVLGMGPFPAGGGFLLILDDGLHGHRVRQWLRLPFPAYNRADGSTRPACGDLDGDGKDEIVVGLGPYSSNGGNFAVFARGADGRYVFRRWGKVPAREYDAANGETRPACGDLDGDGKDEVVIGLGRYTRAGGFAYVFDDLRASLAGVGSIRLDWSEYNAANGETWPACGDFDGDGKDEVVLGVGRFPGRGGACRVFDDASTAFRRSAWITIGWRAYRQENGELRPAAGELDGTPGDEIVLGTGPFPSSGGWAVVIDPRSSGFVGAGWGRVPRAAYDGANGETWPAVGRLR